MNRKAVLDALRITGIYILAAAGWIIVSDEVVKELFSPELQHAAQTYKGIVYVILTGFLLACLIYRRMGRLYGVLAGAEALLQEKQYLLKEVHHRVKNNMQLMLSLVNLQQHFSADEDGSEDKNLEDVRRRFRAMAIVHELAYHSEDFQSVVISEYFNSLISGMDEMQKQHVAISVDADGIVLPVSQAIPCGLILVELMSNTLQHAFPAKKPDASLRVSMKDSMMEDRRGYHFVIEDNGAGFVPEKGAGETLGFSLVKALTQQLKGTLSINAEEGTRVAISFPFP
jgi:two-component system, sensor histidine kinase PdtaS